MTPIVHETHNHLLRAPREFDAEFGVRCDDLAVRFERDERNVVTMTSHWRPSPEELAALNAGAAVAIKLLSHRHPPIAIAVEHLS